MTDVRATQGHRKEEKKSCSFTGQEVKREPKQRGEYSEAGGASPEEHTVPSSSHGRNPSLQRCKWERSHPASWYQMDDGDRRFLKKEGKKQLDPRQREGGLHQTENCMEISFIVKHESHQTVRLDSYLYKEKGIWGRRADGCAAVFAN